MDFTVGHCQYRDIVNTYCHTRIGLYSSFNEELLSQVFKKKPFAKKFMKYLEENENISKALKEAFNVTLEIFNKLYEFREERIRIRIHTLLVEITGAIWYNFNKMSKFFNS